MSDKEPLRERKKIKEKMQPSGSTTKTEGAWSLKSYAILAVLFFVVMSDTFLENVLVPVCPSCMNARELTTTGAIASIICIIIFHAIISNHL